VARTGGGALVYPLSRRPISAPVMKRKPPAPSTHYVVQVRVTDSWEDLFIPPSNTSSVTLLSVANEATPGEVVEMVCSKAQQAVRRPHYEFALVETTADMCLYPRKHIFLTQLDEEPLRTLASFPYMLALVVDPFVKKREDSVQLESVRREAQITALRKHYQFIAGYRELLDRISSTYAAHCVRAQDTWLKLYALQCAEAISVEMRVLEDKEAWQRNVLLDVLLYQIGLLHETARAVLAEAKNRENLVDSCRLERAEMYESYFLRGVRENALLQRLRTMYDTVVRQRQQDATTVLSAMRSVFHSCRIRNDVDLSIDSELEFHNFRKTRLNLTKRWYSVTQRPQNFLPDVVNPETISGDYFKTCGNI